MQPAQTEPEVIVIVRAHPAKPYTHYHCGLTRWVPDPTNRRSNGMRELRSGGYEAELDAEGRPLGGMHALRWPATEVRVRVVAKPKDFDPLVNGGIPTEISPQVLKDLMKDDRVSVKVLGAGDSVETATARAEAVELEDKLAAARRSLATAGEESARFRDESASLRAMFDRQAAEAAAKIAALEAEIAVLRASGRRS